MHLGCSRIGALRLLIRVHMRPSTRGVRRAPRALKTLTTPFQHLIDNTATDEPKIFLDPVASVTLLQKAFHIAHPVHFRNRFPRLQTTVRFEYHALPEQRPTF